MSDKTTVDVNLHIGQTTSIETHDLGSVNVNRPPVSSVTISAPGGHVTIFVTTEAAPALVAALLDGGVETGEGRVGTSVHFRTPWSRGRRQKGTGSLVRRSDSVTLFTK